jgi:hypothetical protein
MHIDRNSHKELDAYADLLGFVYGHTHGIPDEQCYTYADPLGFVYGHPHGHRDP